MKRAALFFDIDGTIISNDTLKIPESALEALAQAQANGHLLFINTGRTYCALPKELYAFDFDGYLCGCGCHLIYRNEVILENHIEPKRCREILEEVWACNLGVVTESTEDVCFPKEVSRFAQLEWARKVFGDLGLGKEMYIEDENCYYDKLYIYTDEQSNLERFLQYIDGEMEAIDRGNGEYEVVQSQYSKASACEFVLQKFGMTKDQAYVFGDSLNDLSMFTYAEHSIAMGDHAKGLEPYTEFITKKVEEDGIAHALKHYGLI